MWKLKTQTIPSTGEVWSKGNSALDSGEHTLCISLDNSLALRVNPEQMHALWPSNSTPSYIPRGHFCTCSPGHLCNNVRSSPVHNRLKGKQPKCPLRKIHKNKILFIYTMTSHTTMKTNELQLHLTWVYLQNIMLKEKTQFRIHTVCFHLNKI